MCLLIRDVLKKYWSKKMKKWFTFINERELIEKYFNIQYFENELELNDIGFFKAHFAEVDIKEGDESVIEVLDVSDLNYDFKERIISLIKTESRILLAETSNYIVVKCANEETTIQLRGEISRTREEYSKSYLKYMKIAFDYLGVIILCFIIIYNLFIAEPIITIGEIAVLSIILLLFAIVAIGVHAKYSKIKKEIIDVFDLCKFEKMMRSRAFFKMFAFVYFIPVWVFLVFS